MKYKENKIVYEVGDWVVVIDKRCNFYSKGAFKITGGIDDNWLINEKGIFENDWFRPATQEEIDKATEEEKIMVGTHEVKFIKDVVQDWDYIKVGDENVGKELFLKIGRKTGWL